MLKQEGMSAKENIMENTIRDLEMFMISQLASEDQEHEGHLGFRHVSHYP